ncbi:MerR family transcriptional regulator [Thermoleophilum album]|uniref:MerR family transcriptional regulator n=1 Tax=Thermoleophilum album TaxID=29539 RepID=UPI00237D03B6|nr:MerR family transcriptional regulator [Thermoleophilum album]MCL6441264.1 MerR family transcriptional regulator [Thermoleophilum sp.]WDT93880.1 MerR family transcriptional regulator [Thermoleophilum album]
MEAANGARKRSGDVEIADERSELTIDELARRTGMTVRNIRAYQSRGLLPPPEVRGRTGYYGPDHVARIELIKELQADGFKLDHIRRLLDGARGSSHEVLRFTRMLRMPFGEERTEIVTVEDLAERWGTRDAALLERAVKLGLLRPLGDDRYEDASPTLSRAGRELVQLGIPISEALTLLESVKRHADAIARSFVKLFLEHIWLPFEREGTPDERWPEIADVLERLRPLALESVTAVFRLAMTEATERAFGREIQRFQRQLRQEERRARA